MGQLNGANSRNYNNRSNFTACILNYVKTKFIQRKLFIRKTVKSKDLNAIDKNTLKMKHENLRDFYPNLKFISQHNINSKKIHQLKSHTFQII